MMRVVNGRNRASRQRDDGAAAVEFAIVSTLLLTILFGILQYGFLFFQILSAQQAVGEAAALTRTAVVSDISGNTCEQWRLAVRDSSTLPGAEWQRTSWVPLDSRPPGPLRIDDRVEVTLVWEPVRFAGSFIPAPGTGPREATVTTGLMRLGEGQEYTIETSGTYGCPDPGPGAAPLPFPTPPAP